MYGVETQRLSFVIERDGMEGAVIFAKQTYHAYRAALKLSRKRGCQKPHHATLPEYREGFVMSCLAFRKFIRENKNV